MKTTTSPKPVRPQDDFFTYVNGAWLKAHPIPPSESRWGIFSVLLDNTWKAMRALYEELQSNDYPAGSIEQQARDLYFTALHKNELKAASQKIVEDQLASIAAINDRTSLSRCIGELHRMGVYSAWSVMIDADDKDSTKHMFRINQRVLTLPGREYYLEKSAKMKAVRTAYLKHLNKISAQFDLLRSNPSFAQSILDFEIALAERSRTKAELRDPETNYHKTSYQTLQDSYQNVDWSAYAAALQWQPDDRLGVDQPEFMAFVNEQLNVLPLETWKAYLQWQFLIRYYGLVSEAASKLQFEFFGSVLSGVKKMKPTWKRAVLTLENLIGPGTGKLYAERHFPESSKHTVLQMVEEVRVMYKQRIDQLDWMTAETKIEAQKKLANIKVLIGYPDKWRDYSRLRIGRESLVANALAAERHESDYWLGRLQEPISRDDWYMNPQTVNAYNDSNRLVICFPAAILQPPFFSPKASTAANFGGIGSVIGHELTHGFDDKGCQFDDKGNLRTWQTPAERKAFDKRARLISDQADHFEVLPGLCLNGKLVLGESIADLGGLEIGFAAYRARPDGKKATKRQRQAFFINYAKCECEATRDEALRQYTLSDPHPNGEFRINGILAHVDAFYEAFDIKPGDKLYREPDQRARIW